jgi:hypothetical protein
VLYKKHIYTRVFEKYVNVKFLCWNKKAKVEKAAAGTRVIKGTVSYVNNTYIREAMNNRPLVLTRLSKELCCLGSILTYEFLTNVKYKISLLGDGSQSTKGCCCGQGCQRSCVAWEAYLHMSF